MEQIDYIEYSKPLRLPCPPVRARGIRCDLDGEDKGFEGTCSPKKMSAQQVPRIRLPSPEVYRQNDPSQTPRPLPTPQLNRLHPAYIPHYDQRGFKNHVSFGSVPLTQRDVEDFRGNSTQRPQMQHVFQVTTVTTSPDGQITKAPADFWLTSPLTPHTLDSRRSGLQTFPLPPSERYRNPLHSHPWVLWCRKLIIRYFLEWWLLEILSWCLSAACMVTIIVVLHHYQGGSMPQWPYNLTLNSFISVFSGFSRAALLLPTAEALGQLKWNIFSRKKRAMLEFERLDMAGRGPWGALCLLASTRKL